MLNGGWRPRAPPRVCWKAAISIWRWRSARPITATCDAWAGVRIRGGTAKSYYVGVESAMPAVPGMEPPIEALCIAPFGMEEGTQAELPPQEVGLVVGEPVRFRFFGSSVRRTDQVGAC